MATVGWDGVDPGFSYQFLEEDGGTAKIEDYVKAGWAENDAKTYTHAYHDTFYAETTLPYLRIPGSFEYWDILDKNLSAAMSGVQERTAGARRHGDVLGAGHRPHRPRQAESGLSGGDRVRSRREAI